MSVLLVFSVWVTFRYNYIRIKVVLKNIIKPEKILCMTYLEAHFFIDIIWRLLLRLNKEIVLGGTVTLRSGAPSDMNEVTHVEVWM